MIKTLLSIDQTHVIGVGSACQKGRWEFAVKYVGAEEGTEAGKEQGVGSQRGLPDRGPLLY